MNHLIPFSLLVVCLFESLPGVKVEETYSNCILALKWALFIAATLKCYCRVNTDVINHNNSGSVPYVYMGRGSGIVHAQYQNDCSEKGLITGFGWSRNLIKALQQMC